MSSPQRIREFIAAREGAHGLDPEVLTGYNDVELRMSDLRAAVDEIATARELICSLILHREPVTLLSRQTQSDLEALVGRLRRFTDHRGVSVVGGNG